MRGLEGMSLRVIGRGKRGELMFESISRVKCPGSYGVIEWIYDQGKLYRPDLLGFIWALSALTLSI